MSLFLHIPPPVYALLFLALCKGLDYLLPLPVNLSFPPLGWLLAIGGLSLMFWAWLHFLRKKTTPIPTSQPSALVAEGPYRYSRNPMYLGILSILSGTVFFLGSPVYVLSLVGFFLVADRLFIPYEEARLERLFGPEYADLKQKTKRWL